MIGDRRARDGPPCDSLAEAVVLDRMLWWPEFIDSYDIGPLLVFPEHRWIWRAMKKTRLRNPEAGPGHFFLAWRAELQRAHPQHWANLIDILFSATDLVGQRASQEFEFGKEIDPAFTHYFHGFQWWLARLRTIHEARTGIQAAQRIAEGYWRAPDRTFGGREAVAILERAVIIQRTQSAPPVWERHVVH